MAWTDEIKRMRERKIAEMRKDFVESENILIYSFLPSKIKDSFKDISFCLTFVYVWKKRGGSG